MYFVILGLFCIINQYFEYQIFDNVVDLLFLIDMFFMFMTSYVDKMGIEIYDSRRIAKKYIFSIRFLTDFLAILGTGVVTSFMPSW